MSCEYAMNVFYYLHLHSCFHLWFWDELLLIFNEYFLLSSSSLLFSSVILRWIVVNIHWMLSTILIFIVVFAWDFEMSCEYAKNVFYYLHLHCCFRLWFWDELLLIFNEYFLLFSSSLLFSSVILRWIVVNIQWIFSTIFIFIVVFVCDFEMNCC